MTIQAGAILPVGTDSSLFMGTGVPSTVPNGTATQAALINLAIGSVASMISVSNLSVSRSGSASASITTQAHNYTGNVALSVVGLPFGVSYTMSPATIAGSGTSSLTISVGASAKPGTYIVTVNTAAGGSIAVSALTLTIS